MIRMVISFNPESKSNVLCNNSNIYFIDYSKTVFSNKCNNIQEKNAIIMSQTFKIQAIFRCSLGWAIFPWKHTAIYAFKWNLMSLLLETRLSESGIKPGTSDSELIALTTCPRKSPFMIVTVIFIKIFTFLFH